MGQFTNALDTFREPTRSLRRAAPDALARFAQLHQVAVVDGGLPARVKEPMPLAISVVKQCPGDRGIVKP